MKIVKCKNGNISIVLKEVEDVSEKVIKSNSVDAAFEKHVPMFNILGDKVEVYVNHVMEEDHYIEWILVDYGDSYWGFYKGEPPFYGGFSNLEMLEKTNNSYVSHVSCG